MVAIGGHGADDAEGAAGEVGGDFEAAEAAFQQALELSPDQAGVLNYLGYMWVDRGVRLDEGLALIERAVAAEPALSAQPKFVLGGGSNIVLTGDVKPLVLKVDETKIIHGTDEHISLDNVGRMVRFYQRLVETAASR